MSLSLILTQAFLITELALLTILLLPIHVYIPSLPRPMHHAIYALVILITFTLADSLYRHSYQQYFYLNAIALFMFAVIKRMQCMMDRLRKEEISMCAMRRQIDNHKRYVAEIVQENEQLMKENKRLKGMLSIVDKDDDSKVNIDKGNDGNVINEMNHVNSKNDEKISNVVNEVNHVSSKIWNDEKISNIVNEINHVNNKNDEVWNDEKASNAANNDEVWNNNEVSNETVNEVDNKVDEVSNDKVSHVNNEVNSEVNDKSSHSSDTVWGDEW